MVASIPPAGPPRPSTPPFSDGARSKRIVGLLFAGLATLAILIAGGLGIRALAGSDDEVASAIVRVATPSGNGTGFFVKGPDEHAYVATAFHVVARGEPVLIERNVATDGGNHYVEAFPETEVVAFDADADLAIIRIKNIRAGRFARLALAAEPMANQAVRSYGYPGSRITRRTGLIVKDGKLLSLVKFPVYDRVAKRIVRDNAIEGLLVSTDIEPGFSGGPTCNEDGAVVGVNVTKDLAHRGQNGAVHVKLLKKLVDQIAPADKQAEPTAEQLAAELKRIETEYLMLPAKDRPKEREHGYMALGELPTVRKLINDMRRHERASYRLPGASLSGRAAFGVWAAQLPGKPLETYLSTEVQDAIGKCERASAWVASFMSEVSDDKRKKQAEKAALQACDELALRPLALDLTAATLQWRGKERSYTVSKLERVDDERFLYRAKVRASDLPNLLTLWVSQDNGQLRLKLFDNQKRLYGVKSLRETKTSELVGDWQLERPRTPSPLHNNAEQQRHETLSVSVENGREVSIKHLVDVRLFAAERKLFRCNSRREIQTGWTQRFTGKIVNGVVIAKPTTKAVRRGSDASRCKWANSYRPDEVVVLKVVDSKLVMYRSDGRAFPDQAELERKPAEVETSN